MKITTSQIIDPIERSMQNLENQIASHQEHIASGKRILRPSDAPGSSVKLGVLTNEISDNDQYLEVIGRTEERLKVEEDVLAAAQNLIQRTKELAVQGTSGTLSKSDKYAINVELGEINKQFISLANTTDAAGDRIFRSFSEREPIYELNSQGQVGSSTIASRKYVEIGDHAKMNITSAGQGAFFKIESGNGSTSIFSIVQSFQRALTAEPPVSLASDGFSDEELEGYTSLKASDAFKINGILIPGTDADSGLTGIIAAVNERTDSSGVSASIGTDIAGNSTISLTSIRGDNIKLEGPPGVLESLKFGDGETTLMVGGAQPDSYTQTGEEFKLAAGRVMDDLNTAIDRFSDARSIVGSKLRRLDSQKDYLDTRGLSLQIRRSQIEDVDMADAVTKMQRLLNALEASRRLYAQVKSLSLFSYLRS